MIKKNRKIIFGIVCAVFLVITPLLILISLGYNLNSGKLQNSLQVKIETYPINAKTYLNYRILETNTPTDISITDSGQSRVDISKDNYLDETFWVNSRNKQNLNTRLTQLKLLQEKGRAIPTQKNQQESLNIIDNNLIWLQKDGQKQQFYLQKFNANQLNGQPIQVQDFNKIPTQFKAEFNWQIIGENTFFDKGNQLVIYLSRESWKIVSLESGINSELLPINNIAKDVEQVVSLTQDVFLLRDKQNNLWELNFEETKNPKLTLEDQGINYLYNNIKSKNIWYLIGQKLYKTTSNRYSNQSQPYLQSNKLVIEPGQNPKSLTISNFVQGVVIQVGDYLYYYNDSSKNSLSLISEKIVNYTVFEDTLFWVNSKESLGLPIYSWNFNTNYQSRLGYLASDIDTSNQDLTLDYSSKWMRLLIFEPRRVSSVWYDKSSVNHNITNYSLVSWIENNCSGRIIDQNIFCLFNSSDNKKELKVFENNNLF